MNIKFHHLEQSYVSNLKARIKSSLLQSRQYRGANWVDDLGFKTEIYWSSFLVKGACHTDSRLSRVELTELEKSIKSVFVLSSPSVNRVYRPSLWLWSLHHQRQAAIRTHLLQWIYIRSVKKTLQGLVANDSWNSITFFPVPSSDFASLSSMELDLDGWCWKKHLNQILKLSRTDNWLNSKARKRIFHHKTFEK